MGVKEDIKALNIINKARESHRFCCLELNSDYDYCWEIKWVYASDKKHKEHRTTCHNTLLEVALDFESQALGGKG